MQTEFKLNNGHLVVASLQLYTSDKIMFVRKYLLNFRQINHTLLSSCKSYSL